MADPYVGDIHMFAGNFAPRNYAFCNGQLMAIAQNDALFQLIGTTYGGDGQNTFALPDLRSRVPVHVGSGFALGQTGGSETVALTVNQLPAHQHTAQAQSGNGTQGSPQNNVWAASALNQYSASAANAQMNAQAIQPAGGSQPHENLMPYLAINFIICLFGVFPTQN